MKHEHGGRVDRKSWIVPFLVAGLVWATPGPFAIAFVQRVAGVDTSAATLARNLDAARSTGLATLPAGFAEALAGGSLALVATSGPPVWWELDPDTWTVLGRDAIGWGNAAVDYAIALGLDVFGFAVCMAASGSRLGNAACVAGAFLGWGAGVAALTGATVAARLIAVTAALVAGLPTFVEIHSR